MALILASASPRRKQLLDAAGVPCRVAPVDVDETRAPGEPGRAYVERVAALKAGAASARWPDDVVLAADTTVVVGGDVFEKPRDADDARRMLDALSGRSHTVLTAVSIRKGRTAVDLTEETTVFVAPLSKAEIEWYVASGEPMGKAGAYAIQGLASRFIVRVEGAYTNVVGLPVASVVAALSRMGVP
jgi:septum formation protein